MLVQIAFLLGMKMKQKTIFRDLNQLQLCLHSNVSTNSVFTRYENETKKLQKKTLYRDQNQL